MPPIKPFLEWEVKLARLMNRGIGTFRLTADLLFFYHTCINGQLDLNVSDFRAQAQWQPHPDDLFGPPEGLVPPKGAGASRSSWPVYTENQDVESDSVIPDMALVSAWSSVWIPLSRIEQGRPDRDMVVALYSDLYAAASAAADRLGVTLA